MNFRELIKNLSFLQIGQLLVIFLNVIFYFAFANILGPEKYGNLAFLISIAIIIPTFARFGLSQSVIIFASKKEEHLENSANLVALLSSIIVSLVLLIVDPFVAILAFSFSCFLMNIGGLLGRRKYKIVNIYSIGKSAIWISASLVLYSVMGIPGILLGMAIGNLIFSFNYFKFLNFRLRSFNELKKKSRVLIQNFGVDVSQMIPNQVDKLILVPLFGFQTTGIFHFAIQFLIAIEFLTLVLHRFLLAEGLHGKIPRTFFYFLVLLTGIIFLLILVLSPQLVHSFFPDYVDAISAIQIISIGIIPLTMISILTAKLQIIESNLVGYGIIVRVGTNLSLIPLLGGLMGIIGLSVANLISIISLLIFLLIIYKKAKNN